MPSKNRKVMKSNKKDKEMLKAFTLTEIIVTLAISAILIGIVVKLFTWFSETQKANDLRSSSYETMLQASGVISEMMSGADSVRYSENELTFYFKEEKSKHIAFNNNYLLIETPDYCDTLHLSAGEIKVTYNKVATGLVETIKVPVFLDKQTIVMDFEKEYEGALLVNLQAGHYEN
jgi:prepilin-type N-terminal cleavage/methylation domain-containing protein